MKIKISDVNRMIKEEFHKMMEKKKLSSRLSQINEELGKMNAEDSILNEVEASGMQKTKSATGLVPGNQHGVKFEKIGTHLKEDESEEEEMGLEIGGDMGADMGADMGTEETPMGEFEAKFAEIGRAIDAKMTGEVGEEAGEEAGEEEIEMGSEEGNDDDFEEVEVSDDNTEEEVEEVDEYAEVQGGVGAEQGMTADQALNKPVKESVEEPLEGESVAQMTSADDVNDNMEKDTHVKESAKKKGAVINEAKKPEGKNIFTEGLDQKKKTALLEEMNRMKKFAGLSKDEE
jgi:hypothetical protein